MDGTRLGAIDTYKRIQRYIGEKKLTDLPIFPLRFLPQKDEVVQRLEKRGLKCAQCDGHRKYDGFVYDSKGRPSRERFRGDIYVDYKEYFRKKKRMSEPRLGFLQRTTPEIAEIQEGRGKRSDEFDRFSMDHEIDQRNSDLFLASHSEDQKPRTREQLAQMPELLRLMCHQVVAFTFRTRKWVRLEIDFVENIDKSAEARNGGFDDLVILPKYRRLLVSLVDSHTSDTHESRTDSTKNHRPLNQLDLVRGKGLGLIMLLHGPPGTGKTSTAETIASYTGRPLYSITCGDLGSTPYQIEIKLEKHASRADKWGCVLLLDEADVFLMRRDFKDTDRNALVSIFLRTLEYYPGILFLTTNRVGVIDEAFKSRIHIALRYPRVKLTATLEIWKGCLDRIERDNEYRDLKIEFDRNELMEFAEEHYQKYHKKNATWNGRQIRNAFQTAIALGQYERTSKIKKKGLTEEEALATGKKKWRVIQLTRKNLDTIAETAQDFDKYMKSVHRAPDGEVAKADQLRDDDFSESSEDGESFEEKIIAAKRRSGRRDGSKKRRSSKKKSEKAVASSSARTATRASNQAAKQREHSSSDNSASKEESRESSSERETDDED
ncbi:P-loop containing nucleoside triphosphate hydrolase protein [Hypomontagnella submonticulosa]|nr:P-loop containing nucleoside triphosphate hydrolase protein [Hypomontagnella submonticulosa]